MEERAAGPQECLAGPGPLTQPRWHLLWGKEFQRQSQAAASGPRGQAGSSLLVRSTASILKSKAGVPTRTGGFALQSKARRSEIWVVHVSAASFRTAFVCLPVRSLGRLQAIFLAISSRIPALPRTCLPEEPPLFPRLSALLAVAEPSPCRADAPCSPRRRARRSGTPRLCPRRPCTPRSALPRPPPRSPSAVGPTGRERSSVKGLQTHEGRQPVVQ